MHEVISEFKLILLSLNNYSIAVKWFLSNYCFYFLLLDERSYQPTPSMRTSKELHATPHLQKYLRPSLSSTRAQPTGKRMETACSSKFYTWYFYITLVFIRINLEKWVTCWIFIEDMYKLMYYHNIFFCVYLIL
jgi:hypothetical protein